MRKFFVKIATMALIGVLCLTSLFGCQLITTNNERDMAQKIATIQIDDAPMKIIYKRDVAVAYGSYVNSGYTGSDNSEIFTEIIESLIQNAVLVQYAMKYFAEKPDFDGEKWELESYFEETEILDCKYNAYLQFEQLVEDYVKDKEEEKVGDVYTGSVRTVPTGATVNSEISDARKKNYVDNYWAETITPMYNAFVKAVNDLKKSNLLGDYTPGDIETIDYFNEILTAYEESLLIEKLQEDIEKEARKTITFDKIKEEYSILYNEQANANSTFETSLENASAENPILFGQKGYGMVYHILLKADDDMTAELEDLKESYKNENGTPAYENSQYRKDRAAIFQGITAKDQRESWIKSRYDFGEQTTSIKEYNLAFTGDYTLYSEQSLPFFGSVTHINAEESGEDDYKAKYRVDNVDKFSLSEILEIINEYLYDGTADVSNVKDRATYTASKVNDDYDKRIKELMFAFSQDDSDAALNTYKGYTIKPQPDGTEQEEWMLEFAEVGRQLIIKANENTFMLVATDYGYHIMFFSENFDGYSYPTLEEYLTKEFKFSNSNITSWEEEFSYLEENFVDYENTDNYLYVLYNKLASTYVNNAYKNATQEIYADYANNSRVVVKYPEAYKDLV